MKLYHQNKYDTNIQYKHSLSALSYCNFSGNTHTEKQAFQGRQHHRQAALFGLETNKSLNDSVSLVSIITFLSTVTDPMHSQTSHSTLKYFVVRFRTKQSYLLFQVFQLILAVLIIICALMNSNHFKNTYVLFLELVLLTTMTIDIFIIKLISQGGLREISKTLMGKIDLIIYGIFTLTLLFLTLSRNEKEQNQLLQTDDIIIILIVVSRYGIQIYRMINSIKQTKQTQEMNREIKAIDFNQNTNVSNVFHKDVQNDNKLKDMIATKFSKRFELPQQEGNLAQNH